MKNPMEKEPNCEAFFSKECREDKKKFKLTILQEQLEFEDQLMT